MDPNEANTGDQPATGGPAAYWSPSAVGAPTPRAATGFTGVGAAIAPGTLAGTPLPPASYLAPSRRRRYEYGIDAKSPLSAMLACLVFGVLAAVAVVATGVASYAESDGASVVAVLAVLGSIAGLVVAWLTWQWRIFSNTGNYGLAVVILALLPWASLSLWVLGLLESPSPTAIRFGIGATILFDLAIYGLVRRVYAEELWSAVNLPGRSASLLLWVPEGMALVAVLINLWINVGHSTSTTYVTSYGPATTTTIAPLSLGLVICLVLAYYISYGAFFALSIAATVVQHLTIGREKAERRAEQEQIDADRRIAMRQQG